MFKGVEEFMNHHFDPRTVVARRGLPVAAAAILLTVATPGGASAYTQQTLHSFCTESNCGDGDTPNGLAMDASGNLYGTTKFGGKYDKGLVFKLLPNAKKTQYVEHILKNFCANAGCPDGAYPSSDLIMDVDGDLYGTTEGGGIHTDGAVFKMRPLPNGWAFGVIHSFCAQPPNCPDGGVPAATLAYAGQASGAPWDESSPLFGTANTGGVNNKGVAYELSPSGSGWTYAVLHRFNPGSAAMSAYPGPLLVKSSGDLFGLTYYGGKYGGGALYKLAAGTWNETTLHNFCAQPSCVDGDNGVGRLALDAAGNLFGAALTGGSGSDCQESGGCGVAFEYTAGGKYKVIYDFCLKTNCKDGLEPAAGLTIDANGTLYGTTHIGGTGNLGVVFTLSHGGGAWTEQTLYDFCSEQNCADGGGPGAPVIMDAHGNLYGTTSDEGANGSGGTVFRLKP